MTIRQQILETLAKTGYSVKTTVIAELCRPNHPSGLTTVWSVLSRLEQKGLVTHNSCGKGSRRKAWWKLLPRTTPP